MTKEDAQFAKLLETADDIEKFRFCGPSDDPDEQTAVVYGYKHLVKRLVGMARRIRNERIQEAISGLNLDIEGVLDAYDLHADLQTLIDDLRQLAQNPDGCEWGLASDLLVERSIIEVLGVQTGGPFDLSKVAQLCEEMNSAFARGHYLSCTLLLRTLLNHIPPVFGQTTFAQVVAQSPKSVKEILRPLENVARDLADHHTHSLVRHKECLPTRAQIEPFRPNIEVLLQELVVRASAD